MLHLWIIFVEITKLLLCKIRFRIFAICRNVMRSFQCTSGLTFIYQNSAVPLPVHLPSLFTFRIQSYLTLNQKSLSRLSSFSKEG